MTSAVLAAAVALAGCQTNGTTASGKHLKPLSPETVALLDKKGMPKESPILVRIFKQEAELEVWKQDNSGRYALLKTYPICRWSGELGPKIKEGDRQAPEGFYTITPAQMNPNSQYYLSFNLGYPNAFDQALGRTGAHLMVHGDCSSRGCYAMTDDQIGEIYALGRESFFGGQRAFQVQAYPFRMTPVNFAKHRNNPNIPFWKMLKEGSDQFELTGLEPKVDVCEKRYVFNAQPPANVSPANFKFTPAGRCPAYQTDPEIASALQEKRQRDEMQVADLIRRGTPVAPIRTGADGGMHPTFLAKLRPHEVRDADGNVRMVVDTNDGKPLGAYVNPPKNPETIDVPATAIASSASGARDITASVPSAPASASHAQATYTPASAESRPVSAPTSSGNMFTRLFSSDGDKKPASPTVAQPAPMPKPVARPASTAAVQAGPVGAAQAAPARPAPAGSQAFAPAVQAEQPVQVQPRPPAPRPQQAASETETARTSTASNGLLSGAQPVMPAGSFESRWGAFR